MNDDPEVTMEMMKSNISSIKQEAEPLTWRFWRKRRYIVVLLVFLGYVLNFALRVNLSVSIVIMTENRTVYFDDGTVGYEQYFDWNSREKGLILSSFFLGYIFTQIAGGYLATRFGGNLVFGLGIGLAAAISLLTPWFGTTVTRMIVIRVLQGFFEGGTISCIHDLWLHWSPISERARMASIGYGGMFIGTVICMVASSYLAKYLGWESIFYVFGGIGVFWSFVWMVLVSRSPDNDRFISSDELKYIQATRSVEMEEKQNIPWRALLTSKPVYAIVCAHTAQNWGIYTMITQLPMFLSDTLKYELRNSGLLSAAPYLTMGVLISIAGYLADMLQNKGVLTTTQVRRYFICGAFLIQTVCLILAGFLIDPVWSVVLIIIGVGSGGFASSGYSVNPLDIAPTYASLVSGFSNTFATLPGIVSPIITGFLVQNQTVEEWRIVFYLTAGTYVFGGVVYWFWCSGEVQSWAQTKKTDRNEVNKKLYEF